MKTQVVPNRAMHLHHDVFVLKEVLIHIHTYGWGYPLTPLDPGGIAKCSNTVFCQK